MNTMRRADLIRSISRNLSRFNEEVNILSSQGDFSLSTYAENIIIELLNEVYDVRLVNMNMHQRANYPAIDLLDVNSKTAFQVTATATSDKLKTTINRFFDHKLEQGIEHLYFYILSEKQSRYPESIQELIDSRISKSPENDNSFEFDVTTHILDKSDILLELAKQNDAEKYERVHLILEREFGKIQEHIDLRDYFQRLKDLFYEPVLDDETGLTLDKLYVEPTFSVHRSAIPENHPELLRHFTDSFVDVDYRYGIHEFLQDYLKNDNTLQLKDNYRFTLLLGYPGQGKSSFCKKFLNDYLVGYTTEKKPLFYLALRNVRSASDFVNLPLETVLEELKIEAQQDIKQTTFYSSIVILDGLDELYMKDNLKLDDIDRLCSELARQMERHPSMKIILTSRYGYINTHLLSKKSVLILQLVSFTLDRQNRWLAKYKLFHPESWLDEQLLKEFNNKRDFRHLAELVPQPLLLHMVAGLSTPLNKEMTRSDLYRQMFTEIIERKYSRDGKLQMFENIKPTDLRLLIQEVAFAIFQSGNEYISRRDLMQVKGVKDFLKKLPSESLGESIKGIMISFYFKEAHNATLSENNSGNFAIEFLHKSLQEYMTAEKICEDIFRKMLDHGQYNNYFIDSPEAALIIFKQLFGKRTPTTEIIEHMKQLVDARSEEDRDLLRSRMALFINDMLTRDFYISDKQEKPDAAVMSSLSTFHGFYLILSCLKPQSNLIQPKNRQKFTNLLILLDNAKLGSLWDFDMSHQDLISQRLSNLNIEFWKFYRTDLSKSAISNIKFQNVNFFETAFPASDLFSTSFRNCRFLNVNFSQAKLIAVTFTACSFSDCNFTGTQWENVHFYDEEEKITQFENCNFYQSIMDVKSHVHFSKNTDGIDLSVVRITSTEHGTVKNPIKDDWNPNTTEPANYKRLTPVFRF